MTDHELLERESKRFAGNVKVPWQEDVSRCFTNGEALSEALPNMDIGTLLMYHGVLHKVVGTESGNRISCKVNPTYTIELIVAELKRIKRWDGFVRSFDWRTVTFLDLAKVLTTPLLLLQAASAYIEKDAAYQTGNGG